jgi:hypothetical protein
MGIAVFLARAVRTEESPMPWHLRTLARVLCLGLLAGALCACGGSSSSGMATSQTSSSSACNPPSAVGGPYCLHFVGTAYDVHIGQLFKVALVSADGSNTVIAGTHIAALPGASFTVDLPRSMVAGVPYYVDYFADANRSLACDPPPVDHVWRSHVAIDFYTGIVTTVTATNGDLSFSAPDDDPWINDPVSMNTCAQLDQVP